MTWMPIMCKSCTVSGLHFWERSPVIFLFCYHFELFPKSLSHYPKNLPDGKHSVKWEKRYKEMNQRNFYSLLKQCEWKCVGERQMPHVKVRCVVGVGVAEKRKVLLSLQILAWHSSKSRDREIGCVLETTHKSLQHVVSNGNWNNLFKQMWIKNLKDFHLSNNRYLRKKVPCTPRE